MVTRPQGTEQRGNGGRDGFREDPRSGLADHQRAEDGGQEPDPGDRGADRREPGEETVGTGPEPVPGVEHDAEGDGEDGGDDDVDGPPAVVFHGLSSRWGTRRKRTP